MTTEERRRAVEWEKTSSSTFAILALAAIQFVIAYPGYQRVADVRAHADRGFVEAALALLFFMHLSENRGFKWFVLIFTVFVILGMQYGWTDSFRLSNGAPWAK